MEQSTCLFSRAKPDKPTPKKIRGFLALPGEVRNQIYRYYFASDFRCEFAAKGRHFEERKAPTVKLWAAAFQSLGPHVFKYASAAQEERPLTVRVSRPLGSYNTVKGLQTNWFASLFAISLVCKQVHAETVVFVYRKTAFVFDAPRRITNFLHVVSAARFEHITDLQLHYETYGSPSLTQDCIWQEKHARSWMRACTAASKKLVGLRKLKIHIRVCDDSVRFNLRAHWVMPLLQFRRLSTASRIVAADARSQQKRRLDTVDIKLWTRWSKWPFAGNQLLATASEDLHRLFSRAIALAVLGSKEQEAMAEFNTAWEVKYAIWQHHLNYGKTAW